MGRGGCGGGCAKPKNPSEPFMALTFPCAVCTLYYPSFQLGIHWERRSTLTCGNSSRGHKRAFQAGCAAVTRFFGSGGGDDIIKAAGGKHP